MHLNTYQLADHFLKQAQESLEQNEVVHTLLLAISTRLRDFPTSINTAPYLATVKAIYGVFKNCPSTVTSCVCPVASTASTTIAL